MRSPALALAWQLWRPNRWGLGSVGLVLAILAVLCRTLPTAARGPVGTAGALLFLVGFVYLLSVFVYTEMDGGSGGGFPRRMFTLPLRTTLLVGWPMLYATAGVALFWLAAAWLVFVPCGLGANTVWPPALVLAAFAAAFQAIAWTFVSSPLLRLAVALVVLPGPILAGVYHGVFATESGLVAISLAAVVVSYLGAVAGVARDRRGGGSLLASIRTRLEAVWAWLPRRRAPFASAERAQLWVEWRQKGLLLPCFLGAFLVFLVLATPTAAVDAVLVGRVAVALLVLPPVLAFFVGFGLGKTTFWAKDLGLSPFVATRPLGSGGLALAKLKTAALSAVLAWAVILVLGFAWVAMTGSQGQVAQCWALLFPAGDAPPLALVAPLALVGVVGLTWLQLAGGLCLSLTGRAWVVNGATLLYLGTAAALAAGGSWAWFNPGVRDALLGVLWGLAAVAIAVKLAAACWAVRVVYRKRLLGGAVVSGLVAAWMVAAGALGGVVHLLLSSQPVPAPLIAAGAVLALPLVRLLAAPLALEWNRHR